MVTDPVHVEPTVERMDSRLRGNGLGWWRTLFMAISRPHAPSNHGGRPAMMAIPTTTIQTIVSGMKTFHPSRMIWS